jgi:hypothetical protein
LLTISVDAFRATHPSVLLLYYTHTIHSPLRFAPLLSDFRGCGLLPSPESCYCDGDPFTEKKREQLLQYLEAGRYCNKPWPPAVLRSFPSNQAWPSASSSSSFENCGTGSKDTRGLWGSVSEDGGCAISEAMSTAAAVACSVGVNAQDDEAGWGWGKSNSAAKSDWQVRLHSCSSSSSSSTLALV